jgi:phage baseplate assembly protein W
MRQSIKVLFLLNPFDVPFDQSDFVNLKNFLFENMNHLTASNLVKRVEWAIQSFEKRVEFISAKVTPYESDDGFEVSVTYRIKIIDVIDTFIQQFQKIR